MYEHLFVQTADRVDKRNVVGIEQNYWIKNRRSFYAHYHVLIHFSDYF